MTASVKEALFREPSLQNLSVRGELLGFKLHTSGHAYFTLLGENSRVSCVLFRSYASSVLVWPKDGDEVLVRGKVDVYGARGSYQIYAVSLLPLGAGAKARAKEALRMKLEREGIFDLRLKRPLPRYPERVAVITSPTGAALQDVLKLHALRYPCAEIVVIPSLMQGVGAPEEITSAFERARRIRGLSCLMLVRGGGHRARVNVFSPTNPASFPGRWKEVHGILCQPLVRRAAASEYLKACTKADRLIGLVIRTGMTLPAYVCYSAYSRSLRRGAGTE